jgi:hypothetical protein
MDTSDKDIPTAFNVLTLGTWVYSHGGGVPGFRSEALFAPDLDITIAVSANLIPIDPDIGSITDAIMKIITAAYA